MVKPTVEVLVTGGAGFIGSNFVLHALAAHPEWRITTLDKLTYAGRLENLRDVVDNPRHRFVQGDVADPALAGPLVQESNIVVHFAAETHVDRSLQDAGAFINTDVYGSSGIKFLRRNSAGSMPQRLAIMSTERSMAKRVGNSPKARAGDRQDLLVTATLTLTSPFSQV